MRKVVIIGAGGHGRETLEVLLSCREAGEAVEPFGFIDENPELWGRFIRGLPVLGDFRWFQGVDRRDFEVVCAIGDPHVCVRWVQKARDLGLRFGRVISPRAWVASDAHVGQGVILFPNVVVSTGVSIGDHVTLNVAATVGHDTEVRDFCHIGPGAHLAGNVKVGEGCFIGMGTHIVQGVSIGAWSVIGAGAVVLHDIPSHVTAVGVPARVVKTHNASRGCASHGCKT